MDITPVTLSGRHVRLEPLSLDRLDQLCEVGIEESLWRWTVAKVQTVADMKEYLTAALTAQAEGAALPFVTIEQSSGRIIGSTRYANIDRDNLRLEIGWTWIAPAWQRTVINTEAKYLMLLHAFEDMGCNRVEFKTDSLNEKSRRALLRIGATEEGIFRNHMIVQGGRLRHSVFFSIIKSEWPAIKANLEAKLAQ
ncbi:MAG: N-acetyltransferase [Blastocatellia bacterium]|jgi:RimJ/RimL family protein N-acetyltransferase|nr:N-acetyltransferase [Blastocatellia bacterium]